MIKNQKGMTLVEIMVGVGLASVVALVVVAMQVDMAKKQTELTQQLDDSIDQNLAERIVFKDLNGIDVSYNNIVLKDDYGYNFFDFYPDITENILVGKKTDRTTTLQLSGTKEMIIMTQLIGPNYSLLNFDPVWAYNVGNEPSDPNVPATLTFNPKSNRSRITNPTNGRPAFWQEGFVLMYDTPSRIRPVVNGTVDMTIPPRSPFYLGIAHTASDSLENIPSSIAGSFKMTQPKDGVTAITSLDDFLRKVPGVGGGQTIVRARVVRIVKYYLEADPKKSATDYNVAPANLYMAEFKGGAFQSPTLLADGVAYFKLRRDSVLKRMIYFKIEKAVKKIN